MKRLIFILLATSLTANAWLALRVARAGAASDPTAASATLAEPQILANHASTFPVAALESADPVVWRDQLREAGADEPTIRAIIEGQLRQRYRSRLSTMRVEELKAAWWRNDTRKLGSDDAQLLKEMVQTPMGDVLGRDPLDLQDAEQRFDFLPPAKRRMLAEIELDYAEMGGAGRPWFSSMTIRADIDRQELLADERRKDVMAALTPEERAEFTLRFEGSAGLLSGRLAAMNGTEREFRALRPLLDEFRQHERKLPRGEDLSTAYADLNQKTIDQIAAAIGLDRALDFLWSGPGLYPELVRFSNERGLPATTAARMMQLVAETGVRASGIHHDAAIPSTQKVAALQALQENVRAELDYLVPETIRPQLPATAIEWFTMLGEGRYSGLSPSLSGTGFGTIAPTSISKPANGRSWSPPPRPRR